MVQRSLYEMIGISEDAEPRDVRYAYEQAMRMATRGGDHRRAVQLSAAFDALDPRSRRELFPAARSGPGSARGEHTASLHPGDFDLGPMPAPGSGLRRDGTPRRRRNGRPHDAARSQAWGRRIAAAVVAAAMLLLIGNYLWRTEFSHQPGYPTRNLPTQPRYVPPAAGPAILVPDDAPVDANGTVTVQCVTGTSRYTTTAFPGDTVSCTNGATPRLIAAG